MKRQRGGRFSSMATDNIAGAVNHLINYHAQMKRIRNDKKMAEFYRTEAMAPKNVRQNRNRALILYNKFLGQQEKKRKSFYKKYSHLLKPK